MSESNKVAVVTGASSGIGRALTQHLAKRGVALALCDLNEAGLSQTVQALGSDVKAMVRAVDVAKRDQVFDFADQVHKTFGHVDYVFNNAGVALVETVVDMKLDDFEWLMNINFWGVVYGTKAFLPKMIERDKGHIINISSLFGLLGIPAQSAYCSSKFAVRGFTESLYAELAETGISVSSVHPGGIATDIVRNARFYKDNHGNANKALVTKGFDKIAGTSPDRAAEIIMKGVDQNRRRILVGPDAKVLEKIGRLMPSAYHRAVKWLMDKQRAKLFTRRHKHGNEA